MKLISDTDGLSVFESETLVPAALLPNSSLSSAPNVSSARPRSGPASAVRLRFLLALLVSVAAPAMWQYQSRPQAVATGTLSIETTPNGLDVVIDGGRAGVTPLNVSLPAGHHQVRVGNATEQRDIDVAMVSGATIQHHLEIAPAVQPAAPVTVGALRVQTDLPAMTVTVDGVDRGTSPLTIDGLTPGEHQIVARADQQVFRRTVAIGAGETVSLVVSPIGSSSAAAGWLKVSSPLVMELREGGELIGTTETQRLMLASGEHTIEIVNDTIGFSTSRKVTVAAGKVTLESVDIPSGLLSVNAEPWAEVWMDGERVGETPIANLPARPGSHEVVFRHPQLGERRETVMVTLRQPTRLGVDLRRHVP